MIYGINYENSGWGEELEPIASDFDAPELPGCPVMEASGLAALDAVDREAAMVVLTEHLKEPNRTCSTPRSAYQPRSRPDSASRPTRPTKKKSRSTACIEFRLRSPAAHTADQPARRDHALQAHASRASETACPCGSPGGQRCLVAQEGHGQAVVFRHQPDLDA